jgi:hypothetical protein
MRRSLVIYDFVTEFPYIWEENFLFFFISAAYPASIRWYTLKSQVMIWGPSKGIPLSCSLLSARRCIFFVSASIEWFNRGPGYLAFVWFGSPPPPVIKLDQRRTGRLRRRENLLIKGGLGGGEKAWSSINHSVFSALFNPCIKIGNLLGYAEGGGGGGGDL